MLIQYIRKTFFVFSGCKRDVVFVLDSSNSVTRERFKNNLLFISSVMERLHDMDNQFAIVSSGDNSIVHLNLGHQSTSIEQLHNVVGKVPFIKFIILNIPVQ